MPVDPSSGIWLPRLSPKQLEVFNAKTRYTLVSGPRLTGKCVDAETLVHVNGGLGRIGSLFKEVPPGLFATFAGSTTSLDAAGNGFVQAAIDYIYHDPCKVGLRVFTKWGYTVTASHQHPIWACVNGRFGYVLASEIQQLVSTGTNVWLPIKLGVDDWSRSIPVTIEVQATNKMLHYRAIESAKARQAMRRYRGMSRNKISKFSGVSNFLLRQFEKGRFDLPIYQITIDEELAYFIGLMMGDGCTSPKVLKAFFCGFSSLDPELIDAVRGTVERRFGGQMDYVSRCDYRIRGTRVIDFFYRLGLNKLAHEKRIPDEIIKSPKSVVRAFLQGLFDTDGWSLTKGGRVGYCSASESLARDVHQLLLCFGIRSRRWFKPNKCRGAWSMDVATEDVDRFYKEIGFRLPRKQSGHLRIFTTLHPLQVMDYPPEVREEIKRAYLSRHERGAEHGNLPRSKKHSGFNHIYDQNNGASVSTEKLRKVMEFSCATDDAELNRYFMEGKVFWEPVVSVSEYAAELFDFSVPERTSFIGNGFVNHNTLGTLARVLRHAWETPDARIAVFSKTVKNAKSGVWADLTGPVMNEWLEAELCSDVAEFAYTTPPKIDGATRMHYFRIRNYWGGESEVQLHSLDYDGDVEDKVLSTRYSMVYFSELQHFSDPAVFRAVIQQLRMPGLPYEKHMWIADTNPPESGIEHFAYQIWYTERQQKDHPDKEFQNNLGLIEFQLDDGIFADPKAIADLKATYRFDPEGWDRFVLGKWTRTGGHADKHFSMLFRPAVHVAGSAEGSDESKWEYLNPDESTTELISGWDIGHVNHSFHIMERTFDEAGRSHWHVLDELVSVGEKVPVDEFGGAAVEKIDNMEPLVGHPVTWRHWTDTSAYRYNAGGTDDMDAATIERISKGRVHFLGAYSAKTPGSVRKRVALIKQLLAENRLTVSAHCFKTIEMFMNLRKGKKELDYVLRGDEHKHPFDSLTYAIYSEMLEDLEDATVKEKTVGSRLVSV